MIGNSSHFLKVNVLATVLAGLMMASCAELQPSSPEQVQTRNPSVTYKYRTDDDLIQAGQRATTYCNQYQSIPRTVSFGNDTDGEKIVVFDCVPASAPMAPRPQFNPNLTYNYRSDQELVDAARNAQIYCMNRGSQQVVSNIVTNANGTRTVTFYCNPR